MQGKNGRRLLGLLTTGALVLAGVMLVFAGCNGEKPEPKGPKTVEKPVAKAPPAQAPSVELKPGPLPGAKAPPAPAKKPPEPAKKPPEPAKKPPEPAKKPPEPAKKPPEPAKKPPEPAAAALKKPKIAVNLPEKYNTPDGMVVDAKGNIILSCPNFNDDKFPAKMLLIDKDDKITELITLPIHPETKKPVGALGVDIGSDGNLYVADNQAFGTEEHKSRLIRIVMKDGKALKCEVVATGFVMSNAIACHGDCVYVTETKLDTKASPLPSGVYRFKMSELKADEPVKLIPGGKDPHLILTIHTKNKDWAVGANGMAFDKKGDLYVCNFGDAKLHKFTLDKDGKVTSSKVVTEGQGMLSCDGMKICPTTGDIYIADFLGNAVHKVDPASGKVTTIAKNPNTDGADGSLDRCSEVCIRGKKIYVANIDLTLGENKYDKPHTISVIEMD